MRSPDDNNPTDRILVERILRGDTDAFSIIIRQTEKLVTQIIFRMVSNPEDRKDIVQDVYFKAFRSLKTFRFESKLSTWIANIAYNTSLDYLKKGKLMLADDVDEEAMGEMITNKTGSFVNDTEKRLHGKVLSEIIKIQTEKLPPIYKTLITLYHTEELSYAEIAAITQLPEGTVKSYLYRARKKLKDNLLLIYNRDAL